MNTRQSHKVKLYMTKFTLQTPSRIKNLLNAHFFVFLHDLRMSLRAHDIIVVVYINTKILFAYL